LCVLLALGIRDIDLRPRLFPLVAVENAQRDVHADPHVNGNRRISSEVRAERRVRRPVGDRQPVVRFGLLHGLHRCFQVGTRIQRRAAKLFQRKYLLLKFKRPRNIEAIHGRSVVEKHQHGDFGDPQVHLRRLQIGFVLHPLQ